ncbi:uncharacterized protein BJ171DRAFT_505694 [Polychytrium aggregatum]|uniref:uncharacterized protein n=1 Tax=Polychytrium aggregatum TaxID=110093 RepID=UPI0022FE763E|nr:uncharacterized protein BJ171DRAFT_505694 [Polychytrium aggregatum]KAI9204396.1 hypothetical protein BJ171DRAFT_505694 [Polychytrium aggregatum]
MSSHAVLEAIQKVAARHFRRQLGSRLKAFAHDIYFVQLGVRPVFLNDYFISTTEELSAFVRSLHQISRDFEELGCMVFNEEFVYFCHRARLAQTLRNEVESRFSDRIFVNVSKALKSPQICKEEETAAIISQLDPLVARLLDRPGLSLETTELVIAQELIPAVSGWLLGYPVVYTLWTGSQISDSVDGLDNCLGSVQLRLFEVNVDLASYPDTTRRDPSGNKFRMMSFSCPIEIYEAGRSIVDGFKEALLRATKKLGDLQVEWNESTVCYPKLMV